MSEDYEPSSARGRRWFVAALVAMVSLAVAAGVTLSRIRDADAGTGPGQALTDLTPSEPSSAVAEEPTASAPAEKLATRAPKEPPAEQASPASTEHGATGPAIARFAVASKPVCPSGTDQVRYEGQPVRLEWKVTGADRTTLAVDGPGVYATYGTTDSAELAFPCSGEPGGEASHTYTLTAIGENGTKSKTITVKARIQETAVTGDS
ncbi:hypothetical protein [Actinoplanes subglobosus]|uniref:Ig-like domain-containing protein n=1 Tax=Actinoplanes subglobosus TaxID=1547892 RepID=A0ABV8J0G1_9ACTN